MTYRFKTNQSIRTISAFLLSILACSALLAQVSENERRYIRIGELQDHVSAYGSERAYNNSYYEGMRWPADYPYTDNAVIRRAWVAVRDFTDATGQNWNTWATYIYAGYALNSIWPMELEQTARFDPPAVYVDGSNITAPYAEDVDKIIPNQIPDRIVNNVINTTSGLTITRRVRAFSQQYHDDYFIKEFVLTNTGNVDNDPDIELTTPLKGVRFGWGTRYSVCREGAANSDNQQSWGKHSWVTRRGEDYPAHVSDVANFTENTPRSQLDWIRCSYSWLGQSEVVDYDMIGAPAMKEKGRLSSPQFAGTAVLHVDKGPQDQSDDPNQPVVLGWYAGDTYPSVGDVRPTDATNMDLVYEMLSGNSYPDESYGGSNRMFEDNTTSITDPVDPYIIHGDGGGTNVWVTYGPYDLEHGDSIKVVEVEAISGLDREKCIEIGRRWKQAYDNSADNGPFALPDGGTTDEKDLYKNSWVYTGMDSILLTFSRALRNYNLGYNIPQAPLPPPAFTINSGGDKISLTWVASGSEGESNFGGYRLYRAIGKPDTTFERIAELAPGTYAYDDKQAQRGQSYYYYLTAYSNGSGNMDGVANPTGILESGRFYTRTNKAAVLQRMAGQNLDAIRIVPNPFTIKARNYQFIGEPDKIMFLDVPAYCKIRIFTERGDLIDTIIHDNGSGDQSWNSITSARQVVVSGVYLVHFEVTQDYYNSATGNLLYKKGDSTIKKLLIIR